MFRSATQPTSLDSIQADQARTASECSTGQPNGRSSARGAPDIEILVQVPARRGLLGSPREHFAAERCGGTLRGPDSRR
jgi:hypothetical protein